MWHTLSLVSWRERMSKMWILLSAWRSFSLTRTFLLFQLIWRKTHVVSYDLLAFDVMCWCHIRCHWWCHLYSSVLWPKRSPWWPKRSSCVTWNSSFSFSFQDSRFLRPLTMVLLLMQRSCCDIFNSSHLCHFLPGSLYLLLVRHKEYIDVWSLMM